MGLPNPSRDRRGVIRIFATCIKQKMSLFAWPVRSLSRRSFASSSHLSSSVPDTASAPHPPPKDALPPLNRPLGVRERPTTLTRNTITNLKSLMDLDTRMAQRRHLSVAIALLLQYIIDTIARIKEASVGYFHDLNMTRKHGGKTWLAPKVLIREDVSCFSPRMTTRSDTRCRKPSTCPISQARALTPVPPRIQPKCVLERSPYSPCLAQEYLRQDPESILVWSQLIQRQDQCQRLCRPRTCAVCFTSTLPICPSQPPGEYPQVLPGHYVPYLTSQGDTARPTIDVSGVNTKHGVCP